MSASFQRYATSGSGDDGAGAPLKAPLRGGYWGDGGDGGGGGGEGGCAEQPLVPTLHQVFPALRSGPAAHRTPSTHGLFDFHFSSNIYFEVVNPIL